MKKLLKSGVNTVRNMEAGVHGAGTGLARVAPVFDDRGEGWLSPLMPPREEALLAEATGRGGGRGRLCPPPRTAPPPALPTLGASRSSGGVPTGARGAKPLSPSPPVPCPMSTPPCRKCQQEPTWTFSAETAD